MKQERESGSAREPLLTDQPRLEEAIRVEDGPAERDTLLPPRPLLTLAWALKLALLAASLAALACSRASYYASSPRDAPGNEGSEASELFPYCRKSSLLTALPCCHGHGCGGAAGFPPANCSAPGGVDLVVWGGIGLHKAILDDLLAFDVGRRAWRVLQATPGPQPIPRWKAGNALAVPRGMVVVGGDAYTPHTFHHEYENAIWLLEYPGLQWTQAVVDPLAPQPYPRRGHSTMLYRGADGKDRIVLFAGRTRGKILLNDVWEATLDWPTASWRLVAPQQPGGKAAPMPRRGHSAVFVPGSQPPQMLVYGGREDLDYFNDIWRLDLESGQWSRVQPEGKAPPGRDHHSVAFYQGRMFVFAGRTGATYSEAKAINELWAFDLSSSCWERIHQKGALPLPRFEQSYVQYAQPGNPDLQLLLVFGGQTEHVCQLNDVWQLDLKTLTWTELSRPLFCSKECRKRYRGS